jgi:hypothetical protein
MPNLLGSREDDRVGFRLFSNYTLPANGIPVGMKKKVPGSTPQAQCWYRNCVSVAGSAVRASGI